MYFLNLEAISVYTPPYVHCAYYRQINTYTKSSIRRINETRLIAKYKYNIYDMNIRMNGTCNTSSFNKRVICI